MALDRRNLERFAFDLPASMWVAEDSGGSRIFETRTRDVSSKGAFFMTRQSIDVGTEVQINMSLALKKSKDMQDNHARVKIFGKVVRADEEGVAVSFWAIH